MTGHCIKGGGNSTHLLKPLSPVRAPLGPGLPHGNHVPPPQPGGRVGEQAQTASPCPGGDGPRPGWDVSPWVDIRIGPSEENQGQTQPRDGQARPPHRAAWGGTPHRREGKGRPWLHGLCHGPEPHCQIPGTGGFAPGIYISSLFIRVGFTTARCTFKLLLHARLRAVQ